MMIVKNAELRLKRLMKKCAGPNYSPTAEELNIFSVLTATLFLYDPIGIKNALDYRFSIDDIYDEYDIEAVALLRCRAQWHDAASLGHAIKEVLDHYFAENYAWEDCYSLAEESMKSIVDSNTIVSRVAIERKVASKKHEWIPISID